MRSLAVKSKGLNKFGVITVAKLCKFIYLEFNGVVYYSVILMLLNYLQQKSDQIHKGVLVDLRKPIAYIFELLYPVFRLDFYTFFTKI
jgi:hypothetical protein